MVLAKEKRYEMPMEGKQVKDERNSLHLQKKGRQQPRETQREEAKSVRIPLGCYMLCPLL